MYDEDGYYDDGDDWSDMRYYGPDSENLENLGEASQLSWDSYAGSEGDKVSFGMFYFDGPAKLSFYLESEDAPFSLTVYALTGRPGSYSLKALQTTTTKKYVQTEDGYRWATYLNVTSPLLFNKSSDTTTTLYLAVRPTYPKYEMNFSVCIDDERSCFFEEAEDGWMDDWSDRTINGPYSDELYDLDVNPYDYDELFDDWVGMGDAIDFRTFSIDNYAKLSLTISASAGNVQLLICSIAGSYGRYSLKPLASTTVSYVKPTYYYDEYYEEWVTDDEDSYRYKGTTKSILLRTGEYYIAVLSKNAAKGGSADYTVSVNASASTFFEGAKDGWKDDWSDMRENGAYSTELGESYDPEVDENIQGWVGMGDAYDYHVLSLDRAAQISLSAYSTGVAKLTIYKLEGEDGRYSLKTLQTTNIATRGYSYVYSDFDEQFVYTYKGATKTILLERGDYYLRIESPYAKTGASVDYSIQATSVLFFDADDGWNNKVLNGNRLADEYDDLYYNSYCLDDAYYEDDYIFLDDEINYEVWVTEDESWSAENFVGYGDEIDYQMIEVDGTAKVSFMIESTSAVKISLYQLVEGRNDTYKLNLLCSSTTTKKTRNYTETYWDAHDRERTRRVPFSYYGATTKQVTLKEEGEYFLCIESTNAKQDGAAYYTVTYNCSYWGYYDASLKAPESDLAMAQDVQDDPLAGMSSADVSALRDSSLLQETAGLLA